jgi:hypothetical protein
VTNAPRRRSSGRKRHILTDTLGLLLAVNVHSASVQDRDGAEALLREARRNFPFVERITSVTTTFPTALPIPFRRVPATARSVRLVLYFHRGLGRRAQALHSTRRRRKASSIRT